MEIPRDRTLLTRLVTPIAPWLAFVAFMAWGWRIWDIFNAVPAYEDVLEVLFVSTWYQDALRLGLHPAVYPLSFFPHGWQVATFAGGPLMFVALYPLQLAAGAAFAYNALVLFSFAISFAGALKFGRRFLGVLPATVAAILFTFWGFRWFRIIGHLNIALATSLIPWILWSVERCYTTERVPRRLSGRVPWALVLVGLLWAITINCSMYFIWIGGLLIVGWVLGRVLAKHTTWRGAALDLAIASAVAVVLSLPGLYWFWIGSEAAGAQFYAIDHITWWDASLNTLPIPYLFHPWLQSLARLLYHGSANNEPDSANLGLLAALGALVGLRFAWRDRRWRPFLILAGAGLVLSVGVVLKWDGQPIRWERLRPLDALIWQLGHTLKPSVFVPSQPPAPFDTAVPTPGLLLTAFVPFLDRARVFARYTFVACVGVFWLAALALAQVRRSWLRVCLAGLLMFEVVPPPSQSLPFPPAPHPAFEWLRQQELGQDGIVDLFAWLPNTLTLMVNGNTVWATRLHRQPTVAGASSVWPPHVDYLDKWLGSHLVAFQQPDFAPLLRYYRVRLISYHVTGGYAEDMLEDGRRNPELRERQCFAPLADATAWAYPICIFEVLPARNPRLNVLFRDGWSGPEDWGVWAEGTMSRAEWIATQREPYRLTLDAFPNCAPGRRQRITLEINKRELASHEWEACETWSAQIQVPAAAVGVGTNEVVLRSAYSLRPVDVTNGQNSDPRSLSIAVNSFRIEPEVPPRLLVRPAW